MIDIFVALTWVLVVETVVLPVLLAVVAEVWEVTRIEVVVERREVVELALVVVGGIVVEAVVAADWMVTSKRRLELPLGTVPLAPA